MLTDNLNYHLWSVAISPSPISSVDFPCKANPRYPDGYLPIFTAPMSSVVTTENFRLFEQKGIHTILPRTTDILLRLQNMKDVFCAFTADEVKMHLIDQNANRDNNTIHVCIDELNGNTTRICNLVKMLRDKYGKFIKIMVGNVGNAQTFKSLAIAGATYVRLGLGVSNESNLSDTLGIFTPMATLIDECRKICYELSDSYNNERNDYNNKNIPYIIADGGMTLSGEINKALALGADYVMLGYAFVTCLESAAQTFHSNGTIIDQYSQEAKDSLHSDEKYNLKKKIVGVYSKEGQIQNGINFPLPELGYTMDVSVKYTLDEYISEIENYMQQTMSFCNAEKLSEFIGKPKIIPYP